MENSENIVWKDCRRLIFGIPWPFTNYKLTEEKLLMGTGILNIKEEEVRLFRIVDVTLSRSIWERIFGLGTVHVCSADKTTPEFSIAWIKNAQKVKDLISEKVEVARKTNRVIGRELMFADGEEEM
jgi:uncharacterized membrane protein YdbT with pleckstrin-like domain